MKSRITSYNVCYTKLLRDFINQLENSCSYKIYHKLYPAIMQGDKAEASIINALDNIYKHEHFFDAVILIRGGGSTTDLMCFDGYDLALNIAQFPLPVITGIGHERDESVADMVAHTKLKTPTAVAEFIIETISAFHSYVDDLQDQFLDTCRHIITHNNVITSYSIHYTKLYDDLIDLAKEAKLISQSTKDLSSVIKNYRNLIHPGREIRKSETFDFDTAVVAKSLLNIIVKEIRENYLNNLGYSAKDLISKLQNDALSQTIFEKLLTKVHKSEKSKLFTTLA